MASVTETVHIGGQVPADLAEQFQKVAEANERRVAAELRIALRAHVEKHADKAKAGAA